MLIFSILIFLTDIVYTLSDNAGSAIFKNKHSRTECWTNDDIIKLRARKAFENLIPTHVSPDQLNGKYIKDLIRYFRKTLRSAEQDTNPHVTNLMRDAIADTIGAHLRSEILPTVRFAFYAGYVPFRNARQIHNLFDEMKVLLNTHGEGWRPPERIPRWSNLTVTKILIGARSFFDPCTCLVTKRDANSCIHLPTPRLDDDTAPSAIALPFKTGGLVSLTSPHSNNALLKYYTTAARCILSSSPEICRHPDFLNFNNDLWNWMKRDVAPHLIDEKLYSAYGGVLRIAAAVQTYGKGLSRRNLFEYQEASQMKWHPWKSLTQPYINIDAEWSPKLYVGLVLVIAAGMYVVQMVINYLCGSSCNCKGLSKSSDPGNNVTCRNVQSIPPAQPYQSSMYSSKRRVHRTPSKGKSASLRSVRTQKVYDLNEDKEKLMVITSGNESATDSSISDSSIGLERKSSPPMIETSISEIRIARHGDKLQSSPISTSTVTRKQPASYTASSESESTSKSVSSTSSKSNRSRSSRDLTWARRVISKHTSRSVTKSNSTSRTEVDLNSFTTPQS